MPAPHPRPYRRGSVHGDGHRRPLDREQRARVKFLLRAHTRARRLTPGHELVGQALLKRHGVDGRCDPSHATLAEDAGCSDRTVRRATERMRALGLLRWQTRLIRSGWRAEQTSNAYELIASAETPAPRAPRCGGQVGRQIRKETISSVPVQFSAQETAAAQAALAQRRAVVEGRMLAERQDKLHARL